MKPVCHSFGLFFHFHLLLCDKNLFLDKNHILNLSISARHDNVSGTDFNLPRFTLKNLSNNAPDALAADEVTVRVIDIDINNVISRY